MYKSYQQQRQCPPGTVRYVIRSGDTFFNLARRFNTTVEAIIAANPGVDPERLSIGQIVCIPSEVTCPSGTTPYTIRQGDTLFSLARRFNTTVDAIINANPGIDPQRLQIGQIICIPGAVECPPNTTRYVIKAGDTLFSLARRFNTTVAAIISANPNIDPDNLQIGQVICIPRQEIFPPCPEGNYYTIQSGDTLFSIARRFNVSLDDLIEANPGIDPENLRIGQVICIPLATPPVECPPGTIVYVVRPGDTFFSIAARFNTTVEALRRANPNVNPSFLLVGQRLCVPVRY